MDAKEIADVIEGYIIPKGIDIDRLDGPYAVRGTLSENKKIERLEVGRIVGEKYKPLVKIKLGPTPELEDKEKSYLDVAGFSGTVCNLPEKEYTHIKTLLKK